MTILRPIAFESKSLTSAEWRYSNIEREVLGILHSLEKHSHYSCAMEVSITLQPIINPSSNIQKRCSNPVTMNPAHTPTDMPIMG